MPDNHRKQSEVAFFHNKKTGEFDIDTGVAYAPGSKKETENTGRIRREEIREKGAEAKRHLSDIKETIQRIEAIDGGEEENKILEGQKEQAIKLIGEAEKSAKEYVDYVYKRGQDIVAENYSSAEDFIKAKEVSDELRSRLHDCLIDSVRIANRFITYKFGLLSRDQIDYLAEKEEAAGRKFIDVKRFEIPRNGICPDKVNLKNRDSIAVWAEQLVS